MHIEVIHSMKPSSGESMDIRVIHDGRVVSELSLTMEQAAQVAEQFQKSLDFNNRTRRKPVTLGDMESEDPNVFKNPA